MATRIGPDGRRVIPTKVAEAIFRGDKERLSELGTNGNIKKKHLRLVQKKKSASQGEQLPLAQDTNTPLSRVTTQEQEQEEIFREAYLQRRDKEFHQRAIEANEHLCPID